MITPRKLRVAVLDDYQGVALRYGPWSQLATQVEVSCFADHVYERSALIERLRPFDIVCLMRERTPLDGATIDALPALKLICSTGMWNATLDARHAVSRGICVSGTDVVQNGTPELIWLLLLALARHYTAETGSLRSGGWMTGVGSDLEGRTMGLLGLGQIGARVARVAQAFGMQVLAYSQNLTDERCATVGATRVTKDELLARADFISISLKLSERTLGMVSARELALMKPTAYLINTSRGPLVDEQAVIAALRAQRIAGFGVDAYDIEPLPADHPLRILPNVVATPHIGYVTEDAYRLFFAQIVAAIGAWCAGQPIRQMGLPN